MVVETDVVVEKEVLPSWEWRRQVSKKSFVRADDDETAANMTGSTAMVTIIKPRPIVAANDLGGECGCQRGMFYHDGLVIPLSLITI